MIIAIDPGLQGGIAWNDGVVVKACPMPDTPAEVRRVLHDALGARATAAEPVHVVMERTGGYVPGNSATAAVKFARHCGMLEGVITGLQLPIQEVAPSVWQRKVCGSLPRDKRKRKTAIKVAMAAAYPYVRVTLATADALAILTYGIEHRFEEIVAPATTLSGEEKSDGDA